ncbi:MAG: type I-C CRISPR-associated protein Cas5 [Desulfovibrionaceae bacterium]|jgi:CRISPR-associated protein Cas5d|nr:type I-C CRISPR-associated protein Cas5 [Desulfovibrionaceae bacterium]
MHNDVVLKVWSDFACFTRPEMKVERVSYDVITPSAARAVLEAIHWKPAIRWVVERLHVLRPVRFTSIRRNEVASKASTDLAKTAMRDGRALGIAIEDDRQQRASLILRDVAYVIEARMEPTPRAGPDDNLAKHMEMFCRRAAKGQCFHRPYLGCREFPAHFELLDAPPASPLRGSRDLGWMLHDLDYGRDMEARFFRAAMVDGVIAVPPFGAGAPGEVAS